MLFTRHRNWIFDILIISIISSILFETLACLRCVEHLKILPLNDVFDALQGFIFELIDLYDKKNIPKVIYCIHALRFV
jgi:hypothetical protein